MGQHTQPKGNILADWTIKLTKPSSQKKYSETLRLVCTEVIVDNKKRIMCFITNNFDWAPSSICDLYKFRWLIEEFFNPLAVIFVFFIARLFRVLIYLS
ncbi:MAG: hypothetical protein U9O87_05170 [Verrucomicrobiota bacterium]|nr:hypothetical protein [Verrucomicrobiota bacterium]